MISNEQMGVIRMIEDNLDIKFNGTTKLEATQFISSNMDQSMRISDYYKRLLREKYGSYKSIWVLLGNEESQ